MQTLHDRPLLVLIRDGENRQAVLCCAEGISARTRAHLLIVEARQAGREAAEKALKAARDVMAAGQAGMIVADWPAGPGPDAALRLAAAHNVPGVFVRWPKGKSIHRVIVPTSGGPHALQQIWVAQEIASAERCACQPLCVTQSSGLAGSLPASEHDAALAAIETRALGIAVRPEICAADDVVTGICGAVRPSDSWWWALRTTGAWPLTSRAPSPTSSPGESLTP